MAKPQGVDPVKLFVAALWSFADALEKAEEEMRNHWGEMDFTGPDHPFDMTDYYEPEMGRNLKRRLLSFSRLVLPDILCRAKHTCNQIENRFAGEGGRRVNLDVGYLDHNKIVLASFKAAGQKIYLGEGVWADLVARYRNGGSCPFEWTFPDFRDGRYDQDLLRIRQTYMKQLRIGRKYGG
jgi:hypothetical protein